MSHTVVRGKPNAAQLYLDRILDAILLEQGVTPDPIQRDNVTLSQIMFYCLNERPHDEFMTNGSTGEVITNEQMLKRSVSLTRALTAQGAKGKYAMVLMRNHQDTVAIYFATMFTGVIPFFMDPSCTVYELTHFLKLIEPSFIFHGKEFQQTLHDALAQYDGLQPSTIVADEPGALDLFTEGYSDDIKSFHEVANASMDDTVMLLPTSGSTGLPKATIMTHRGLVAQLPTVWSYHTQFPTPTSKMMILTTIQWMTFTIGVTAATAYHVPILISPRIITPEHVADMCEKYRPTWSFMTPAFAINFVPIVRSDQLTSLETLILLGAPPSPDLLASLQEKLPKTTHLSDCYGTTETQGFISFPDRNQTVGTNGWIINCLHYKIVDDQGRQLGLNQSGELYLKGVSLIKGYHKDTSSYDESFTRDGWFKTGDMFHVDEKERISFVIRKKFSFKFKGCQVAPEEVERVICSVPGVHESVVCASDGGPTAAVVLQPDAEVPREKIHEAVDSTLSEHKRLHGGIAFVTSLPHTHSGKLKRTECRKLIEELIKEGRCC